HGKRTLTFIEHPMPLTIGHRYNTGTNEIQHPIDQGPIPREADFQGVFQNFREHDGGRFRANDRAVETGGQQIGNATNVVNVYVGDDQGADVIDGEIDGQALGGAAGFGFGALEQAAVYQDARRFGGWLWLLGGA